MRKGYVLSLSLNVLVVVSALISIRMLMIKDLNNIVDESLLIYERLESEKQLYDEILFFMSLQVHDDFTFLYNDYSYDVSIDEDKVSVMVLDEYPYTIDLIYDDDCICIVSKTVSK